MDACIGCHSLRGRLRRAERPAGRARLAAGRRDRGRRRTRPTSASTCRCRATTASSRRASRAARPTPTRSCANGVVAHHADDCIGCQYCTWNCPYSVPAFQPDRRIVTKCDMCQPRLDAGLDAGVRRRPARPTPSPSRRSTSPRGAPTTPPATRPSCRASTSRCRPPASSCPHDVPLETFAASDWNLRPEHPHWPLVWLTLLSQLAVGVERDRRRRRRPRCSPPALGGRRAGRRAAPPRPAGVAWKALRNLRRSWLSREVALLVGLRRARGRGRRRARRSRALAGGRRRGRRVRLGPAVRRARAAGVELAAHGRPLLRHRRRRSGPLLTGRPRRRRRRRRRRRSAPPPPTGRGWRATAASRGGARCASSCGWFRRWTVLRCASARRPARGRRSPAAPVAAARAALAVASELDRPLAVLRHRRAAEHARLVLARHAAGSTDEPAGVGRRDRQAAARRRPRRRPLHATSTTRCAARSSASRAADHWVRTTCGYCSVGCGMLLGVRDGRAVAVQGDPTHPVNRGRLCPKGLSEHHTIDAAGRLTTPTVDGATGVVGRRARPRWSTASGSSSTRHGPESVAVLSTGQLVTEEFYALGKLVRLGMGLRHYDGNTTLCMASAVVGLQAQLRHRRPARAATRTSSSPTSSCCGAPTSPTTTRCSRRGCSATGAGATVIAVDPRVTKTAMVADVHVPVRPRGDIALLNGILRVLLDEGLVDLDDRARPRRRARRARSPTSTAGRVERAAAESGIDRRASCATLARTIGARRALRARLDDGRQPLGAGHRDRHPAQHARRAHRQHRPARARRRSRSPASATPWAPARPASPRRCPATAPTTTPAPAPSWPRCWGIDEARLPTERGPGLPRHHQRGDVAARIKGLWIIGTNPVVSFPNREMLELALRRLDLLVVQDGFETPTTALADVVLPGGDLGREGRHVHEQRAPGLAGAGRRARRPARPGPTSTSSSPSPTRWGCADELFAGWTTPARRVRRVAPGLGRPPVRLQRHHLGAHRRRRRRAVAVPGGDDSRPARRHAAALHRRALPPAGRAGRGACRSSRSRSATAPRPDFPFAAQHRAHRRALAHPHQDRAGRRSSRGCRPRRGSRSTPPTPPPSACGRATRCGSSSERGAIDAHPGPGHRRRSGAGEVFIPFHWDERCANRLTDDEFDPISREPNYKQCAVRVERRALSESTSSRNDRGNTPAATMTR